VLIRNVPLVAPSVMVSDAGTLATVSSLASAITTPPAGAGAFNVAVPRVDSPPLNTDGSIDSDVSATVPGATSAAAKPS
jgi:hypothetical protein